jgi:hypothetical protein
MHFTAHNIRLPDGTETWSEGALLEEYGTFRAPVRMLNLVFLGWPQWQVDRRSRLS